MKVKKWFLLGSALATAAILLAACNTTSAVTPEIDSVVLDVEGYEFGPAVPKLIVKFNTAVSAVSAEELVVKTVGVDRTVEEVYLSDENGKKTTGTSSDYISIQMPISYSFEQPESNASPFFYSMETFQNTWAEDYTVAIEGLTVTAGGKSHTLDTEVNAIDNRISADLSPFTVKGDYSGEYKNPLTGETEELTLQYRAYEPDQLDGGDKNPLLIWLHGQGEGGTDTDITLLGNEVVALAREDIQQHFTSADGSETGAYILAVQTPTYWMDEGDGTNGAGAGVSRYTEILMDTIKTYVSQNKNIDSNRIYLAGCSNGGYMTLNLAIHNPDYFAALAPLAAAYSYYDYERNEDGTYKLVESDSSLSGYAHVRTDKVWFTEDKLAAIKDLPIWFVHSADDFIVNPATYALPIYQALVKSGAENKWFSYYETVLGTDVKDAAYLGHWSWIYFFNDHVTGVQDVAAVRSAADLSAFVPSNVSQGGNSKASVAGQTYQNIFDWLNDQRK